MNALDLIREKIKHLYNTNPQVHLNVNIKRPRVILENSEATITGVYPHIFIIEECTSGTPKQHTLQYTDVLIKNIVILELEEKA